jgi:hypothetical protein
VWKGKLCGRCEEIPSSKAERKNFFSPLIFPLNESEPSDGPMDDGFPNSVRTHTKKKIIILVPASLLLLTEVVRFFFARDVSFTRQRTLHNNTNNFKSNHKRRTKKSYYVSFS